MLDFMLFTLKLSFVLEAMVLAFLLVVLVFV